MPQVINTNVMSLNAQRNLNASQTAQQNAIQRLSSGLRINSAKDDAAGLAISERFAAQVRGMNQAVRNAQDGISLAQTAEGALASIGNNLQRIRELAVQSSNATNSSTDRAAVQTEVSALLNEVNRVADQTAFNGVKLIDGSFSGAVFQVGANAGESITVSSITDANTAALGSVSQVTGGALTIAASTLTDYDDAIASGGVTIQGTGAAVNIGAIGAASSAAERAGQLVNAINNVSQQTGVGAVYNTATGQITLSGSTTITVGGTTNSATVAGWANATIGAVTTTTGINLLDVSNYANAQLAIQQIDSALSTVNTARASLGAVQSRFESTVSNLQTTTENLAASKSRTLDADYAAETAALTRAQILQQAGVAMLAQANASPQSVLALLRG